MVIYLPTVSNMCKLSPMQTTLSLWVPKAKPIIDLWAGPRILRTLFPNLLSFDWLSLLLAQSVKLNSNGLRYLHCNKSAFWNWMEICLAIQRSGWILKSTHPFSDMELRWFMGDFSVFDHGLCIPEYASSWETLQIVFWVIHQLEMWGKVGRSRNFGYK